MPLDWKNYSGLVPAGCLPCCAGGGPPPPAECACALLIPFDPSNITPSTPYSDYATAASAIADYVYDCILYANGNPSSVTVDTSIADEITAVVSTSTGVGAQEDFICLNLYSGESLTIDYDLTTSEPDGDFFAAIYDCTGTQISFDRVTDGPLTGTLDLGTVPADGIYKVYVTTNEFIGTSSFELVFNSTGIFANPVIALWDDSGTTRQLETCPKLILPLVWTGGVNDWYADSTEASGVITEMTADCFIYSGGIPFSGPQVALSASIASGTVSIHSETSINAALGYVAIFVEDGETVDVAYTVTAGSGSPSTLVITVRDMDGNQIGQNVISSPSTGTVTVTEFDMGPTLNFPYTGKFYIEILALISGSGTTLDADITTTGAIDLYPIQALYGTDPLLDCPARLDCP